jgi:hypothetical protein
MRAHEITEEKPAHGYQAYELDEQSRDRLAKIFPPKYSDFIGHHITYKFGVKSDRPLPEQPNSAQVVGYSTNGESLETLVVSIDGSVERPDGKVFHITWSLDREDRMKPNDSNKVIKENGYEKVSPVSIKVAPGFFRM